MATTATATTTASPAKRVSIPGDALKIVLFGMPDSGKSALLGALAHAAATQERALQGRIFDLPAGMSDLRQDLTDQRYRETAEEVVPHVLRYEPFQPLDADSRWPVVLIDCNGKVAGEYLTEQKRFLANQKRGSLPHAIAEADALVLVVDGSADARRLHADFQEFSRFLQILQAYRCQRRQVGGFPVTLVLTKCDRLAQPNESANDWFHRVEHRKAEVLAEFSAFLQQSNSPFFSFGSLELGVTATAIQPPIAAQLPTASPAPAPAASPESVGTATTAPSVQSPQPPIPIGVAELFHQTFVAAKKQRLRDEHSQVRLFWTLLASTGLVAIMAIFGVLGLILNRAEEEVLLAGKVRNFQSREGQTASSRLAEAGLLRRLAELTELRNDPDFDKIPTDLRTYVTERLDEMTTYRDFRDRLIAQRPPARLQSMKDLDQLEAVLTDPRMQLPEPYRDVWAQTEASQLRAKWLKDMVLLRTAVSELSEWYDRIIRRGNALLFPNALDGAWSQQVAELLRESESLKYRETDRIGDSISLPTVEGQGITYSVAYHFDTIERRQTTWRQSRERLVQLRDMADALGILGDPRGERAVLVFPASNRDADIISQARRRLDTLQRLYPEYRQWSLGSVPDPVRPEIEKRMRAALDQLIRDGQILVERRMQQINPAGSETYADWQRLADWLSTPAIQEWRQLIDVVQRLIDPLGGEPVVQFVSFLRRNRFELVLREVKIKIPELLRDARVVPAGRLLISTSSPGGAVSTITLRPTDAGQRDRLGFYRFVVESGDPKPIYKPGDLLTAELVVRDGTRELKLSWVNQRSSVFQFDRLLQPPQLHLPTERPEAGELAPGVLLQVDPASGLPEIPELMPERR
ncbi:GTPase domain-containing protein [Tuwongella immobilis]|uniref:: MMR_HSR1 n=1 Tax=Tuwongella immobilis TaxID=692036 RepID=A0A6C2YM18_9BACT|nr:GTPase domain-containing protein [Tuwongella immobilis]VIP02407.1 : MMR_HSR1 [Tuwongella immobilis]VTS01306.1 : MMR_HSR1 [Tuwongella immobilis]